MKDFISIQKAIEILNQNDVVAIPTETVYGLAARIDSDLALKKIFTTKSRPFFDPLIVHISNLEMLNKLIINPNSDLIKIAEHFWPGPLTIVFDKNPETVSDLITASLSTVAVRWPSHPVTLNLINQIQIPIAAPSANPFKKTSPTEAQHVRDYFPNLNILDGGTCEIGLESTIIKLSDDTLQILRPGQITKKDILQFLKSEKINIKVIEAFNQEGPGSMAEHYQPHAPLYLFVNTPIDLEKLNQTKKTIKIELPEKPQIAARLIYKTLIEKSNEGEQLVLEWKHDYKDPNWTAIFNRLKKAATKIYE